MYIGETENRGIAICPKKPRKPAPPKHAKLRAKPATTTFVTHPPARRQKKHSPNYVLITATVLAAILVISLTLATAIKYYLKRRR